MTYRGQEKNIISGVKGRGEGMVAGAMPALPAIKTNLEISRLAVAHAEGLGGRVHTDEQEIRRSAHEQPLSSTCSILNVRIVSMQN